MSKDKYYLGSLCKHGHDYLGTGKTLRYTKWRSCIQCGKERHTNYVDEHQKEIIQYRKRHYKSNKEKMCKRQKINSKEYYRNNKEIISMYQMFYRAQHKAHMQEQQKTYKERTINSTQEPRKPEELKNQRRN